MTNELDILSRFVQIRSTMVVTETLEAPDLYACLRRHARLILSIAGDVSLCVFDYATWHRIMVTIASQRV